MVARTRLGGDGGEDGMRRITMRAPCMPTAIAELRIDIDHGYGNNIYLSGCPYSFSASFLSLFLIL